MPREDWGDDELDEFWKEGVENSRNRLFDDIHKRLRVANAMAQDPTFRMTGEHLAGIALNDLRNEAARELDRRWNDNHPPKRNRGSK